MKWTFELELWERDEYNANIAPIIHAVAEKMDELIGFEPILGYKPVKILNDYFYGQRLYLPLNPEYYKIGLTVGHLTYGKVVYQFSHELCLLYSDPRSVTWLDRVISHMASFYFLDYLIGKWEDHYPNPEYKDASQIMRTLKNEKLRENYEAIDIMQNQVSRDWVYGRTHKIHKDKTAITPILLDFLGLEILPYFQEDPTNWRLVHYLNQAVHPPVNPDTSDLKTNNRARPDLQKLYEIVPSDLKDLVERIVKRIWDNDVKG